MLWQILQFEGNTRGVPVSGGEEGEFFFGKVGFDCALVFKWSYFVVNWWLTVRICRFGDCLCVQTAGIHEVFNAGLVVWDGQSDQRGILAIKGQVEIKEPMITIKQEKLKITKKNWTILLDSFEKLFQNFTSIKPTLHQAFYCKNVIIYLISQMFASGIMLVSHKHSSLF